MEQASFQEQSGVNNKMQDEKIDQDKQEFQQPQPKHQENLISFDQKSTQDVYLFSLILTHNLKSLGPKQLEKDLQNFLENQNLDKEDFLQKNPKKKKQKPRLYRIVKVDKIDYETYGNCLLQISELNALRLIKLSPEQCLIQKQNSQPPIQYKFKFFPYECQQEQQKLFQQNRFVNEFVIISQPSEEIQDQTGSYGEVLMCQHKIDFNLYAIKRLYPIQIPTKEPLVLNTQFQKNVRECQALMRFNHPNIVRCFNWWIEQVEFQGSDCYQIYIQMEYIGDSFNGSQHLVKFIQNVLMQKSKKEKRQLVNRLFLDLHEGLQEIHKLGYVHRDIRPENIFIQQPSIYNNYKFRAVLGDFGMAKNIQFLDDDDDDEENFELTKLAKQPSEFMVKPWYSAQEVTDIYDNYTDIYNLGIVLYDMLSCKVTIKQRKEVQEKLKYGEFPQDFTKEFPYESNMIKVMTSFEHSKQETGQNQRKNYINYLQGWQQNINLTEVNNLELES